MARKKEESIEAIAPDPVLDTLNSWSSWVQKNIKLVGGGLLGVLALVGIVETVSGQSERDAAAATTELSDALKLYEEATDPQKVFTSTVPGALDADMEKARTKLDELVKKSPGTGTGQLARLYQADLARRLGKHADAEALYSAYAQAAKADDVLLFLALEGQAQALEAQGKDAEALAAYGKLEAQAQSNGGFYRDQALLQKGRLLEKKGDAAGAKAAYKAIVDLEPPSDLKSSAEERMKALE